MPESKATVDVDRTMVEFERIVQVCDGFEAQWRRGERPRIEEFLARNPSLPRPVLFRELLALELELARAEGRSPTADEYRATFPDLIPVIEDVFTDSGPGTAGPRTDRPAATDHDSPGGSASSSSSWQPARIGRYTVLSLLDEGRQGQIFHVVHPGLEKDLVLKLAARPVVGDQLGPELLAAEGRLLAELDHPNLVRVLDLDVHEDGRPFLVMEYVAGCTLDRHIEQGLPAPRRAAAIVAEIARAVGYVHGRGVVHQDIKPRNILIDEAGHPRLIDFGLARLRHAWVDETSGPSGGTLMFMAPEQARGEIERVGPAADIHALGALLYFLLTGQSPVGGGSRSSVYERARRGAVDIPVLESSAAPRRLRRICLKALAAEPADRYATADELAEQLERVARGPGRATTVAACVVLILVLLSALALRPWSERVAPPPALVGSDQALVHILKRDRPYDLQEALPLKSGDQLWVSCKVPHGTRPSMFWLDSEGALSELTPEVVTGEAADALRYPPSGANDVVRLQGPPGTELVLVCARRDQPVARQEIEALLGAGRPLPTLPDRVILRLGPDGVEASGPSGLRSISDPVESDLSAALGRLRMLQSKLRAETSFLSGIAFPHVAD
jgi:eukaryotic-like serine/threonine-protein kinase